MPERFTRVVIHNKSRALTLVRTFDHICNGDWTPGGWHPPAAISPGTSGAMQSEGDGFPFPTGTEGYVKYDVMSSAGRAGMVYIHWSNPLIGSPASWPTIDATDVFPLCDFDPPETTGSSFAPPGGLSFTVLLTGFRLFHGGQPVTSLTELVGAYGPVAVGGPFGLPVAFGLALGLQAGVKDPEWHHDFVDVNVTAGGLTAPPPPPPPPPGVAVPDVVGWMRDDAVAYLATEGYQVTTHFTPSIEEGYVVRQIPGAGAAVAPPALVTLVIGGGPVDPTPPPPPPEFRKA